MGHERNRSSIIHQSFVGFFVYLCDYCISSNSNSMVLYIFVSFVENRDLEFPRHFWQNFFFVYEIFLKFIVYISFEFLTKTLFFPFSKFFLFSICLFRQYPILFTELLLFSFICPLKYSKLVLELLSFVCHVFFAFLQKNSLQEGYRI